MRRSLWALVLLAAPAFGGQSAWRPRVPRIPPLPAAAIPPVKPLQPPPAAARFILSQTPIEAPKAALPALEAIARTPRAEGRAGLPIYARADEGWDGGAPRGEEAREEELVYVNREARRAEAVQYAHAERPALDHSPQAFSRARAEEFAATLFDLGDAEDAGTSGLDILSWLTTEHAVLEGRAPSENFEAFGRSELQVREIAETRGVSVHRLQRAMDRAFRHGLLYRLYDLKNGKTYYGVPYEARTVLNLVAPEAATRLQAQKEAVSSEFARAIAELAQDALSLAPKDEIFEFVAQSVKASKEAGILKDADLPEAFAARARALDLDSSSLSTALLTLLESAHGTPWFEKAKALCAQAAEQGLLSKKELSRILADL